MEDLVIELFSCTYRMDLAGIKKYLEQLWREYQVIINGKPNWKQINRARAILYFIGHIYPEWIAVQSLERRVRFIKPSITLDLLLIAVDRNDKKVMKKYQRSEVFQKLVQYYKIVKNIKNRVVNGTYLDEATFNKRYKKLQPKDYY